MINEVLALRIKELRQANGITLEKLGLAIDMKKNSLSGIENCKQPISLWSLVKIADYFNVSIDYLTGRTDKKEINK